jgi:hypothetical protein
MLENFPFPRIGTCDLTPEVRYIATPGGDSRLVALWALEVALPIHAWNEDLFEQALYRACSRYRREAEEQATLVGVPLDELRTTPLRLTPLREAAGMFGAYLHAGMEAPDA